MVEVTDINDALFLLFIIFLPALLFPLFWSIAEGFKGRKGAVLLVLGTYLAVNLVLPIAGGIRYLTEPGDQEQVVGTVLLVLLFRGLEIFGMLWTGSAKALWTGRRE